MESTPKCPTEKPHALGTGKASHVISKLANYGGSSQAQKISPTIRIVHIFAPKVIKTDAANFRSLVQKLTGKSSSPSSAKSRPSAAAAAARAVQKSKEKNTNVGRICSPGDPQHDQILPHHHHNSGNVANSGAPPHGSQLAAPGDPSVRWAKAEENPEFLCFQEYPFGPEFAPLAEVKAENSEEAANPWDNLAGFFGGFGELDILLNSSSGPLLPDFPPATHLGDQVEAGICRSFDPVINPGGYL